MNKFLGEFDEVWIDDESNLNESFKIGDIVICT